MTIEAPDRTAGCYFADKGLVRFLVAVSETS